MAKTPSDPGQSLGTRFRLFPQSPATPGYSQPETVWIAAAPDTILPGPQNDRMYVVEPLGHKDPYAYPYLPPFNGLKAPPIEPGPDRHWDHLEPNDPGFVAVHLFGCIARVLDVMESYIGHRVPWHFEGTYERLEIIPLIEWDNAQSAYGLLEFGYRPTADGGRDLFALNFDVIAHELGHSILFSELGLPRDGASPGPDFFAYHESVADLTSLLTMLHFDTAADRVLRRGRGNLMALNELNRVAELADEHQIRIAGNGRKLSEVSSEVHDRSRPFTGGMFDALIETYHDLAVQEGLVELPRGSIPDAREMDLDLTDRFEAAFSDQYELKHFQLKAVLSDARDVVAEAMVSAWPALDCERLSFTDAAYATAEALQSADQGDVADTLMECMAWREIVSPYDSRILGGAQARPASWI